MTYTAKYTPARAVYKAPAPIPQRTAKLLQSLALEVHQRLGCQGATRVDFRMDRRGRPFVLEINTVPGMTETSLLPMAAQAAKLSYESLVEAILQSAIERADVFEKERVLREKAYSGMRLPRPPREKGSVLANPGWVGEMTGGCRGKGPRPSGQDSQSWRAVVGWVR